MPDWRHAIERRLERLRLPPAREAEIVEELAQHLDDRYHELRRGGAPEDAARREALSEIDEADLVREWTGLTAPAVEPLALGGGPKASAFGGLWQDLRFGARLLVKDAGASLGDHHDTGAGDCRQRHRVRLRGSPAAPAAADQERGSARHDLRRRSSQGQDRQRVSIPDYLDIKRRTRVFEDVLAMTRGRQMSLTGAGDPIAVGVVDVTPNLFRSGTCRRSTGRLLLPGEDTPGEITSAVLAHHFWTAHFAGDPAIDRPGDHAQRPQLHRRGRRHAGDRNRQSRAQSMSGCRSSSTSADRERTIVATVMGLLKTGTTLAGVNTELATIGERLRERIRRPTPTGGCSRMTLRESTVGSLDLGHPGAARRRRRPGAAGGVRQRRDGDAGACQRAAARDSRARGARRDACVGWSGNSCPRGC